MFSLGMRMWLLVVLLFGILYVIATLFMSAMGITSFWVYVVLAGVIMMIQYMLGPKIVEWTMRVKYLKENEMPWLFEMVQEQAQRANIPTPKIGISGINIPNAFAFGRSISDGRVCVTQGIVNLLDRDELKAVIGHELSHIKNRDMLFITFLSVIPLILYRIFFHLTFFGGRRRQDSGYTVLIGLAALLFYFITNLLVLYASRIREYFADKGSVQLGNSPEKLASALYKLVYGSARSSKEQMREIEGVKAFFLNDLTKSRKEIQDLAQLDLDRSGTIDANELEVLKGKDVKLTGADRVMEALSTHPNMLKRIKQLSTYK